MIARLDMDVPGLYVHYLILHGEGGATSAPGLEGRHR